MSEQYLCKSYSESGLVFDCTCGQCALQPRLSLQELERELQTMKPRSQLFELVKAEMKRRGHWKNKPRGRVFVKGQDERRLPLVRRESGRSEGRN